ncbi:MAG: hypothetical protein V2I37_09575 [Marinilabiliaceae bacterium]|jgi:hypothetical protein|nr:hypothetical protein [Marinilabiliaceae bacterium]
MKYSRLAFSAIVTILLILASCGDKTSERFKLLTGHAWQSDSLLVDGMDASGPGEMLEKFVGEAMFYEDGSGYFGQYTGGWYFSNNETDITITSDSLALPLTSNIDELTGESFKISTRFTTAQSIVLDIRITFKAK